MLSWQGLTRARVAALTFLASTRYLQGAQKERIGPCSGGRNGNDRRRNPAATAYRTTIRASSEGARHHEVAGDVQQEVVGLRLGDGAARALAGKSPDDQPRRVGRGSEGQGVDAQWQPDEVGLRLG